MHFRNLEEFWPFYVNQRSKASTRSWLFCGILAAGLFFIGAILIRWWLGFLVPIVGYGLAWYNHFFIEGNTPATFRHTVWSLLCDFKMFGLMLTGQMDREIKRLGKRPTMQDSDEKNGWLINLLVVVIIWWLASMKTRSSVFDPPVGVAVTTPHFKREEAFRRSTFVVNIFHYRQIRPLKLEIIAMMRTRLCLPDSCVIYLSKFCTVGLHSRGFGLVYDSMGDDQKYDPSYKLKKMVVRFDIPNSIKDLKNHAKKNPPSQKKKFDRK